MNLPCRAGEAPALGAAIGLARRRRLAGAAYRDADHHAVSAVIKWVEQGVAPDKIIATKFDGAVLTRSRPICAYPGEAVYNGSGDIDVAANFSCQTPRFSDGVVTDGDLVNIRNSLKQRGLMLPNRWPDDSLSAARVSRR